MKTIKLISILALMLLTSVTANAQNSLVGDVNKDGTVNIADVTMVVDIILHGQKELSLSVNEISLSKGNNATIKITSGFGSYTVSCADTNIAYATLFGSTVIITGISGGTTVVKVIDVVSGNMQEISVTVIDDAPVTYSTCPDENHPHLVDLGLPSGTKWACCNVASDTPDVYSGNLETAKPEAYGGYYAWGEIHENVYDLYKLNGPDISGTEYDVAHVRWGGNWCIPTLDNIMELLDNCTSEWVTLNNVKGRKFTSKTNGSSIFLPAAGSRWYRTEYGVGKNGYYWSSTPNSEYDTYYLYFSSDNAGWCDYYDKGPQDQLSVRPVSKN